MGKIIAKKVRGMRLWAKGMLVLTLTLLVTALMYQGWYKPGRVSAALLHNSTNLGGNTKWPNNANGWGVTGGKYGAFNCATCHSSSATNLKRVKSSIAMANISTFNAAGTATGVTSSVSVSFINLTSMGKDPNPTTYNASVRVCQACHTRTAKHNSNNQRPQVTDHTHNNGVDCTGCHLHNDAFKGAGECLTCHDKVQGARAAVVTQMNGGNLVGGSHHVQGTTLTNAHCYQCHMEADTTGGMTTYHKGSPGGAVNLVVYGANGVRGTNFISYTASLNTRASITKLNLHCLSCHNSTNTSYVAGTLNVTARNYFNDGKAPNNFSWDSTKTSIDTRYTNAATVTWLPATFGATVFTATNQTWVNMYGSNKKNTLTKALSAHGRPDLNQRGYTHNKADVATAAATTDEFWTNTSGAVVIACFDCHNSHGSSVVGTVTSYTPATTTGGILKDVIAGQGGYSVSYRPYSGGSAAAPNKNKHTAGAALCFDCHNTKNAGDATKSVGGTTYSAPWGYFGTYGSTQRIENYFDTPEFGNFSTGSTTVKAKNGAQRRYPVKDLAGSSLNKGGHFGASTTLATALVAGRTGGNQINGVCTQCHDPHGVTNDTSKVTANQYGVPLLKGNWMTSPYREDAPPSATTLTRGGGDGLAAIATASIPRYRIDQNTFGATTTGFSGGGTLAAPTGNGTGGAAPAWTFTLPTAGATNTQGYTAAQFGGLCLSSATGVGATGCHVQANINANTGAASSTTWKNMTRVHNSVEGWASTTAGGLNANNNVHAYTCSKCHSPHTSNLPRLLVTNCLDWKHRTNLATGGSISANTGSAATGNQNRGVTNCGMGAGRFPGGGARYLAVNTGNTRASNSGTWFFGTKRTATGGTATSGYTFATRVCHDSSTAGGAWSSTTYPTSQLWNTKSTW